MSAKSIVAQFEGNLNCLMYSGFLDINVLSKKAIPLTIHEKATAIAVKNLIAEKTKLPANHFQLFGGNGDVPLQDDDLVVPAMTDSTIHIKPFRCENRSHCPSLVRVRCGNQEDYFSLDHETTVSQLKTLLAIRHGWDINCQKMTFNKKELESQTILTHVGIRDDDLITLELFKRAYPL